MITQKLNIYSQLQNRSPDNNNAIKPLTDSKSLPFLQAMMVLDDKKKKEKKGKEETRTLWLNTSKQNIRIDRRNDNQK